MTLSLALPLFIGGILLGLPIAMTMMAVAIAYFLLGPSPEYLLVLPEKIFEGLDTIILTAIPFFLLSGDLMNRSGMADRLMEFSHYLVARLRGGLAYVNILASLLFSGLTGVAVGDIAALAKIEVRGMEKAGYTRAFAAAVTVSSSLVGPIIPPSAIIILYCAVMNVSVGAMFLAAIVPGILMAVGDMLLVGVIAKRRNFPVSDKPFELKRFAHSAGDAALALILPVILIGGIVGGIMTPTEAAAASVFYALVVGMLIYRTLDVKTVWRSIGSSAYDAARLLFMIGAALTMTWIFALENFPGRVQELFATFDLPVWGMIILINAVFIVLGMFMDSGLILILFAPVVAPLAYSLGLAPVQLGIMLIVNVTIGLATPPVGNVLFAISSVIKLDGAALIKELIPFLAVKFVLLILIGMVPALTVFLPTYFGLK
jgi:tripartite ATP-independent transporter DctM subunit